MGTEGTRGASKTHPDDVSNDIIPYLHAKMISINGVGIWAQRGQLRW